MKFFAFHLMPYAELDLSYTEKYKTAWVVLPNSYFDPEAGARLYDRYLNELEYADQCGFDGICINEHHQNAYGLMPIPAVIAGALSRTTKGRLAVLGRALPLLDHPLTVAEEYAMIDQLTHGRLIAGFVRGIGAEYHSFNVDPTTSLERFHEAHDLIVGAWTKPGPHPYQGKYYDFPYVNPWPRPLQQPHPPIWIPSQGSGETIRWASAAERRYTYLQTYSPVAAVKHFHGLYREEARQAGYEASDDQLGWMAPVYVAETDERAYAEAKPHMDNFLDKFANQTPEFARPPGYVSLASYRAVMAAKSSQMGKRGTEQVMDNGSVIIGSVQTVREKLLATQREIGFGNFLALLQFGTLPHDLTRRNIERFATDVLPWVKDRVENGAVAAHR